MKELELELRDVGQRFEATPRIGTGKILAQDRRLRRIEEAVLVLRSDLETYDASLAEKVDGLLYAVNELQTS